MGQRKSTMTDQYNTLQYPEFLFQIESKPARKLVLLGKTGDGKSSSGNTIFGGHPFKTESSPLSITAECTIKSGKVGGREVTVIDTPGIFDTCRKEEDIRTAIVRSIIECAPAVDALLIVLKVERYTSQEKEILDKIVEYCGEDTFKHAVILFTHGEELEGQTIEEFVQKSPTLQELVDKCGGRCHVIDNKHWNDYDLGYRSNKFHVKNLLNTIDKMVEENGHYTNELMLKIEEEIQEEMKSMIIVNLSTEAKREAAKKNVLDWRTGYRDTDWCSFGHLCRSGLCCGFTQGSQFESSSQSNSRQGVR